MSEHSKAERGRPVERECEQDGQLLEPKAAATFLAEFSV